MERGHMGTPTGNVTLPASNDSSTCAEIPIDEIDNASGIVAVAVCAKAACRVGFAAHNAATGAGKTAVQGTAYFDLPADTPLEIPCVGARKRAESIYLCADDTSASTFSWAPIYGGELDRTV